MVLQTLWCTVIVDNTDILFEWNIGFNTNTLLKPANKQLKKGRNSGGLMQLAKTKIVEALLMLDRPKNSGEISDFGATIFARK